MRLFQGEKGAALPLVLIILFVLTLLGTTIFMFNMAETRQVARDEDRLKAHYIARSGAHAVAAYLIDNPEVASHLASTDESMINDYFEDGEFEVLVSRVNTDEGFEYYIKSTAWVGDLKQTITVTVRDQGVITPLIANHLDINSNSAEILGGDVYYVDIEEIKFPAIVIDGEIIQLKIDFDPVVLPCEDDQTVFFDDGCPVSPDVNYDTKERLDVNKSSKYKLIEMSSDIHLERVIGSNGELHGDNLLLKADKINLSNNNIDVTLDDNIIAIVVDELVGTSSSEFIIRGSGHFVLYVHKFDAPKEIKPVVESDDVSVNIFVYDKDGEPGSADFSGNSYCFGTIYAPGATVDYSGGGNRQLDGWIVADKFIGKGGIKIQHTLIDVIDTIMSLENYDIDRWRYDQVDAD